MQKKLFLGYKLRRLREQRALTQAALAKQLELSPSYLNQIENNQRPLTLPVLLRIASIFEINLASFVEDEEARLVSDLREALGDPLFPGGSPGTAELRNATAASPELARRTLVLHHAYQKLQERVQSLAGTLSSHERGQALAGPQFPYEEVRDYFHYSNNYVGPLDEAAERLSEQQEFRPADLMRHLKDRHDVRVKIVADHDGGSAMRIYDKASGTLYLSALLSGPSRAFHLAHQINRVQFETRRFQFRSSPPWATLEGWYYGFQTGRGLPRPVLPQPVRASFRQRHLLRRLHGGRDFSVAGYLLLFPAQGGADPARPAAAAEEPGPFRPDPHASRDVARCALHPHPPQPLHRLSLDPPDLRDPAGEFRAPGLWT